MDTNTIMLIALAVLIVLSAVGIWLANRGSGVEDPHRAMDPVADDEPSETHATATASTTKVADSKTNLGAKDVDNKTASDIRVVDNTKKTSATDSSADFKDRKNVEEVRDTKNPPKNR
jgi:hypothetical protein